MSTLQVANVHLEPTQNNRIQYIAPNTFTMYAGGVGTLAVNSTAIAVGANVIANTTTLKVGNTTLSTTNAIYGGTVSVNGSIGTAGQVLTSSAGANAYWSDSASIGIGQTWQDFTASRAVSTSYQNLTGRPISVQIRITASSSPFQVSTDNVTFVSIAAGTSTAGVGGWIGGIVPPNHYYRINGAATITGWSELR
jgi:hypothetical protein